MDHPILKEFHFERGAVGWGSGWRGGRGCDNLFFIKAAGWKKTQQQPAIVQSRLLLMQIECKFQILECRSSRSVCA